MTGLSKLQFHCTVLALTNIRIIEFSDFRAKINRVLFLIVCSIAEIICHSSLSVLRNAQIAAPYFKMLEYMWNFLKRHKRKFFIAGAVSGGAYLLWKYAGWKLAEWREIEAAECLANAKRQHHFDCNQRTCNTTVLSMLPKLRVTLKERIDTEKIISELKTRPENKVDLWSELKILSFTRTIVTVYSTTMLAAFLRVQLNILGGYMYIDSCLEDSQQAPRTMQASPDVQQEYLAKVQYLLTDGKWKICTICNPFLLLFILRVSLQDTLTLKDMEECMNKLRGQIEVLSTDNDVLPSGDMIHPLGRYMIAPEGINGGQSACKMAGSHQVIQQIMQETRDVIESKDFCYILNNCLDIAFSRLLDNLAQFFRPSEQTEGNYSSFNPYKTKLPLAKVIPMMNGQMFILCGDAPNQFVQELLLISCMKDFAANVYEAFSQVKTSDSDP
ncbi:Peroxisomal biogenesis factor 3 [Holothuria leucospilota]|uniref:Peroxisomal biogenesis factor 3 n=1 Tax=Holothuria leucospilota TaxID=206669 RepID=A0A9Q1BUT0_HOLLE|nr:Peroxisomal biogenesis factor 3 [Holothuria leucospilota]